MAKSKFDLWKETIDDARTNPAWGGYDQSIQQTVSAYNVFLQGAPGFQALSWKLVKAMVWTESGGPSNPAWTTKPMQIGNAGDPGLASLLSGDEGGELIMPPAIAASLTAQNAVAFPGKNIQAGVGYLLMRAATFAFVNVEDAKDTVHDYVVKAGDTLSRIAARNGSTTAELQKLNPKANVLHLGDTLKVRKASTQKTITGFRSLDTATVARLYNTGDPNYADKLNYCLSIINAAK